jgi:proteasome lid subunit RPN8/RPN11
MEPAAIQPDTPAYTTAWPKRRPLRRCRDGWSYRRCGFVALRDFVLVVADAALREARAYSMTDRDREVGGLLVGGFYIDDTFARPLRYVEIEGFVPAVRGISQTGHFTFTHEAWAGARRIKEQRFGDELINVGWHHTHPGIGPFLSNQDQYIQKHHFPEPWMTALVVDPRAKGADFEFFLMERDVVRPTGFLLMTHVAGAPGTMDADLERWLNGG